MATGYNPRMMPQGQPPMPGLSNPMMQPGMMNPMMPGMMNPMMQPGMMGPMMQPGMMGPMMQPGMMGPMMQPGMMGPMMQPGMMNPMMQPGPGPLPTITTPFGAFHCPVCGYSGPTWHPGASPSLGLAGPGFYAGAGAWGLGGLRRWGGTYSPQYVATGLPTDEEMEEMVYDAIDADPLIPYDADINVAVDTGVVTLSGTVTNKRIKHSAADDAWWVPGVVDLNNEIAVVERRRAKGAPRETSSTTS
ncbi:MAG: BON domain-containing protein [Chloroflexi bacterium]|nr:BON domain-containing protein [Chloroflexota bacterium]